MQKKKYDKLVIMLNLWDHSVINLQYLKTNLTIIYILYNQFDMKL